MKPEELSWCLNALVDRWCERRELKPLSIILVAWPFGGGGLTDDWALLLDALKNVRAFGSPPPAEAAQIDDAIRVVEKVVYR